ncbi:MAG: hypothetical protein WC792_02385 [Candidatus Micrarchaeia archaeon]|jgi:hypothetical protein
MAIVTHPLRLKPRTKAYRVHFARAKEGGMSPEQAFLRFREKGAKGVDAERAKRLAGRYLSFVWYGKQKGFFDQLAAEGRPVSTGERVNGRRIPPMEMPGLYGQVAHAVKIFGRHLSTQKRGELRRKLAGSFHTFSTRQFVEDKKLGNVRLSALQLRDVLERENDTYGGFQARDGELYLSPDYYKEEGGFSFPLHEVVHQLLQEKVIKVDLPLASAAAHLYNLEKGVSKINLRLRPIRKGEFDRLPVKIAPDANEPEWTRTHGERLAQWVFQKFPETQKRWDYLYWRSQALTHAEALAMLKKK